MYEHRFAKVYNEDWAFFSEQVAARALGVAAGRNAVLDLGCGTGNFLRAVENDFALAVGVDISPDMTAIAAANCKRARIVTGDIRTFRPVERFDLVTCNFDMINHLASLDEYERVFENVHGCLADGGAFLFDFNTPLEKQYIAQGDIVDDSGKYRKVFRDTDVDAEHVRINIGVYDGDKCIASLEVVESLYDAGAVRGALERAGFKDIVFCDETLAPLKDLNRARLYAICKK